MYSNSEFMRAYYGGLINLHHNMLDYEPNRGGGLIVEVGLRYVIWYTEVCYCTCTVNVCNNCTHRESTIRKGWLGREKRNWLSRPGMKW